MFVLVDIVPPTSRGLVSNVSNKSLHMCICVLKHFTNATFYCQLMAALKKHTHTQAHDVEKTKANKICFPQIKYNTDK